MNGRRFVFASAVAALFGALLVRLVFVSERYPYSFIWDMDLTVAIDSLLLNGGGIPDHISHTGFGLYAVTTASEEAARAAGVLSVARLDDLTGSLNPLAGMAELTDYLRLHSPFACGAIVLLLWVAVGIALGARQWWGLLLLAVLATQPSLTYHASMIRSELYAVLFWSAALAAMAVAARRRRLRWSAAWIAGAGVLLGLAFMTKVQALFYVLAAAAAGLLFIVETRRSPEMITSKARSILSGVAALSALFYWGLLIAAWRTAIPSGWPRSPRDTASPCCRSQRVSL